MKTDTHLHPLAQESHTCDKWPSPCPVWLNTGFLPSVLYQTVLGVKGTGNKSTNAISSHLCVYASRIQTCLDDRLFYIKKAGSSQNEVFFG